MGLVGYSDSEGSDAEEDKPVSKPKIAAKPTAKPTFQKLVDKANPGKIRVGLPTSTASTEHKSGDDIDAPPAKRAKTGGGFSGFNAMLPAPKKTTQTAAGSATAPKRGLGVGINLKTSGQAAFSREPVEATTSYDDYGMANGGSTEQAGNGRDAPEVPKEPEVILIGKPTIFRPLSVANKKGKKKKTVAELAAAATSPAASAMVRQGVETTSPAAQPAPAKIQTKVSLFSIGTEEAQPPPAAVEPEGLDHDEEEPEEAFWPGATVQQPPAFTNYDTNGGQQADITSDLNLTAAERRQLFGRQGKNDISAMNIVNFNTDDEYARNEALRASGEAEAAAQHRGVRAIAPGKHSLKQLVNAATSQKDALEDSFAQGRKNKKEAGNKYGW